MPSVYKLGVKLLQQTSCHEYSFSKRPASAYWLKVTTLSET